MLRPPQPPPAAGSAAPPPAKIRWTWLIPLALGIFAGTFGGLLIIGHLDPIGQEAGLSPAGAALRDLPLPPQRDVLGGPAQEEEVGDRRRLTGREI